MAGRASGKTKSTAKLVDEAWGRLSDNQAKYGFPRLTDPSQISDNWHVVYSMPHKVVDEVRTDCAFIIKHFGRVPWPRQQSNA